MNAALIREPKLDTIRALSRLEELAGEARETLKEIDADRGEPVFLTVNGAITNAIGTLEGVLSAYRYGR